MSNPSVYLSDDEVKMVTALLQGKTEVQAADITGGMFKQRLSLRSQQDGIHVFYVDHKNSAEWIDGLLHTDGKIEIGESWISAWEEFANLGGVQPDALSALKDLIRHIKRFIKLMKSVLEAFTTREIDNVTTIRKCEHDLGIPKRDGLYELVYAINCYRQSLSTNTKDSESEKEAKRSLYTFFQENT